MRNDDVPPHIGGPALRMRVMAPYACLLLILTLGVSSRGWSFAGAPTVAPDSGNTLEGLWAQFAQPAPDARPGVYWYFLDGNQSRQAITEDLESMAEAGIGHTIFLEVDLGIPRGPVPFMSERWQSNFAHAIAEAERLGIEITLGAGPGWAGSGGPWVDPEESMKHLMASRTQVSGPSTFSDTLPVPPPRPPSQFTELSPELAAEREAWWRDVAVLAVPRAAAADTSEECTLDARDVKALFETKPYSIWKDVPRYVPVPSMQPDTAVCALAVHPEEIVNLTAQMDSAGHLTWDIPEGEWTVFRLTARSTGVRPDLLPVRGTDSRLTSWRRGPSQNIFSPFRSRFSNALVVWGASRAGPDSTSTAGR